MHNSSIKQKSTSEAKKKKKKIMKLCKIGDQHYRRG